MRRDGRIGRAGVGAALVALACGLTACSLPGTSDGSAAAVTSRPVSAAGTWVFKNRTTTEELRLQQDKSGALSGDGTSAVAVGQGRVDHSSITVHSGNVRGNTLSLALFITQLDWGTGLTAVENLRCSTAARVLSCHMDLPLYHVRNVAQTFHRK